MKRVILVLSLLAFAVPATVSACPGSGYGKGQKGSHFSQMDSNGDGVITAEEHATVAAKRFSAMDTNGDGKVTKDEIRQHWQQMRGKMQGSCPWKQDCPNGKNCPRNKGS